MSANRLARLWEVFSAFLKLGITCFGGPIAHTGYFREEFVAKRKWIDGAGYIDLLTLCQFLPGPTSSQLGFALGTLRGGGLFGGLAAWFAFTMPSALLMLAFALGAGVFHGAAADGILHGLKLVAVAVVAHAVWSMGRMLIAERVRIALAFAAIPMMLLLGTGLGQITAIGVGALVGARYCRGLSLSVSGPLDFPISRRAGGIALASFAALFLLPPLFADNQAVAMFEAFFHAGALVFGGGHVVLPLLQTELVPRGWISNESFLAGYGLAQAVPGPLFTLAAYLGAVMQPEPHGAAGAALALVAIFLPGLLLVYGMLPFWNNLRERPAAQAAMQGASAAVVGILAYALYNPVFITAVKSPLDFVLALTGFLMLTFLKTPSWIVVIFLAAVSGALAI